MSFDNDKSFDLLELFGDKEENRLHVMNDATSNIPQSDLFKAVEIYRPIAEDISSDEHDNK